MELATTVEQNKRYRFLDTLRGLCILGMVAYHTLFDIGAFFGGSFGDTLIFVFDIIRDFGVCIFVALSGICIHFGKRPVKRAVFISAVGLVVSAVTYIFMPDMAIRFGILTFMGLAAFIAIPLKKPFDKLPPAVCAAVCFVLFLVTFEVYNGYFGFYGIVLMRVPSAFFANWFTALLGFPFVGFSSSDYYPLFPWIFMFFFGFFLWNILSKSPKIMRLMDFGITFLEKIGKYSLYIYVCHQPIIMGILLLVTVL